jgi:hypothetical protein
MTTKIFVSQIDSTNANGVSAPQGSLVALGPNGAYWANTSAVSGTITANINTAASYTWTNVHTFNAGITVKGLETINGNLVVGNTISVGPIYSSNIVFADGAQFGNSGIVINNGNILANTSNIYAQYLEVFDETLFQNAVSIDTGALLALNGFLGSSGEVATTDANGVPHWSKISLWQLDGKNANGHQANVGSYIVISSSGEPIWTDDLAYVPVGFQGSMGYGGSIGYVGSAGAAGPGYQGSLGDKGPLGFQGSVGDIGPLGFQGSIGDIGPLGFQGSTGMAGPGYVGSVGAVGPTGPLGFQGSAGFIGSVPSIAFTNLIDAPASYSGTGGSFLKVNAAATGLVFDSNVYITNTMTTAVNFAFNTLYNPIIHGYGEDINDLGTVTASQPIVFNPVAKGNVVTAILGDTVIPVTIQNTGMISGKFYAVQVFLTQDSTGNRTLDWSGMPMKWPSAENVPTTGPILSTSPGYTDVISLYTTNAGGTWYGVLTMKGFPS